MLLDICGNQGWTWDYVLDWLTWDRLALLRKHWNRNPPLHKLVAAYLKYEPSPEDRGPPKSYAEAAAPTEHWFENPQRFFAKEFGAKKEFGAV